MATGYLNGILRPLAARVPTFGVVTYPGRKTGRTYRTPLNVFRRGNDYLFFLTYGSDVQWVKNILAAGACMLRTRGQDVALAQPGIVTDPELRAAPPVVRFVERRLAGATQFLRMRAVRST